MNINRFNDAVEYYRKVEKYLLRDEAVNCLILSISKGLCRVKNNAVSPLYLAVAENDKTVTATAIQTPPSKLILSRGREGKAVELIARDLAGDPDSLTGVVAPKLEAEILVDAWQNLTGQFGKLEIAMQVHQIETVQPINSARGELRLANESDGNLLSYWLQAYEQEALGNNKLQYNSQLWFKRHLQKKSLYFWQDQNVVSMVAFCGATPNGIRVNAVYTPPEYRGRGYATSCVSAMSQQLLQQYKYCFLFTNLANPISNHIYHKIGYCPVDDISNYSFC